MTLCTLKHIYHKKKLKWMIDSHSIRAYVYCPTAETTQKSTRKRTETLQSVTAVDVRPSQNKQD